MKFVALAVLAAAGCRGEPGSALEVQTGDRAQDRRSFVPATAFVEYVELPGVRTEVVITLSSHRARCGEWTPLAPTETAVSIVVVTPPDSKPAPGVYPWAGAEAALDGTRVEVPQAVPTVRLGSVRHVLPPGGALRFERVELEQDGTVSGTLDFQFSGDSNRRATSLRGRFTATLCRLSPGPR